MLDFNSDATLICPRLGLVLLDGPVQVFAALDVDAAFIVPFNLEATLIFPSNLDAPFMFLSAWIQLLLFLGILICSVLLSSFVVCLHLGIAATGASSLAATSCSAGGVAESSSISNVSTVPGGINGAEGWCRGCIL